MALLTRSTGRIVKSWPATLPSLFRSHATAVEPAYKEATFAPASKWTRQEIQAVYDSPLMELIFRAVRTLSMVKGWVC